MGDNTRRRIPTAKEAGGCLGLVVLALAVLAGVGWLVWTFFDGMDADTARIWALATTLLFVLLTPAITFAGWWFGHTEARGRLAGIDQAVDKVMGAADKVVSIKVNATKLVKQAAAETTQVVILPPVEPAYSLRRSLPAPDDNVIDLG